VSQAWWIKESKSPTLCWRWSCAGGFSKKNRMSNLRLFSFVCAIMLHDVKIDPVSHLNVLSWTLSVTNRSLLVNIVLYTASQALRDAIWSLVATLYRAPLYPWRSEFFFFTSRRLVANQRWATNSGPQHGSAIRPCWNIKTQHWNVEISQQSCRIYTRLSLLAAEFCSPCDWNQDGTLQSALRTRKTKELELNKCSKRI